MAKRPMTKRMNEPSKTHRPANLGDVAAHAGVSTATVSRYLADPEQVRPERRDRIRMSIQALGYIPHAAARALASKRTYMIGAIVPTLDNAIFARGIQALQERLQKSGYTLVVASSNYSLSEEKEQIETLIARGVDAVFLVGLMHETRLFERLQQSGIPYVNTWAFDRDIDLPCVGFDNHRAARKMTQYLIDLGHRAFGVITAETRDNDRAWKRLCGVRDALNAAGIALNDGQIVESHYAINQGRQAARRLLAQSSRPTAIICGNDVLAYAALIECQEQGLDVPAEISISGFDDLPLSQHMRPSLTTMDVPSIEMGQRAGDYLVAVLSGDTPETKTELDVRLVLRGSTAPPPG